nr:reverse transcriptase domain, reverse transcriptase zinc-binding domain protein [Tanacetum cinerariifolium]
MVVWIMKCVTTAGFSICINGETHGYFKGGRGLRQKDQMAPYLFTLVMELLTLIIQRRIRSSKEFRFLWRNGDTAKGRAKVAWKRICKPKEQGGLGIKDLETWNDALSAKHVSNIASKKDTIEFEVVKDRPPRIQTEMIDKVKWKGKDNTLKDWVQVRGDYFLFNGDKEWKQYLECGLMLWFTPSGKKGIRGSLLGTKERLLSFKNQSMKSSSLK